MSVNITREKILQVAEECFSQYGFDATTTRQLAKESGVNMAMLQYYFGCKEKLLETLLVSQSNLISEQLKPLACMQGTALQRLEKMQQLIVDYSWQHNRLYRIVMQELLLQQRETLTAIALESIGDTFRIMKEVIIRGIAEKEFREDADATMVISMLKGTLFFILNMQMTFGPEEMEITSSKERVNLFFADIMKRYLLPPCK